MRYNSRWASLLTLSLLLSVTLPAARKGTFTDAVQESSGIVLGQVLSRNSYYGSDGEIYTDVVIQVGAKVKDRQGRLPQTLTFTVPGGQVGDLKVVFSETPAFADDEAVMLLLDDAGQPLEKLALDGDFVPELGKTAMEAVQEIVAAGEASPEFNPEFAQQFVRKSRTAAKQANAVVNCYALMGPKWNNNTAAYRVATSIPAAWSTSVASGASVWNSAGTPFRFTTDEASTNQVTYAAISGSSGILAQTRVSYFPSTNRMANFTLTFNTAHPWSTTGEAGKFDVQGIMAHEMGHAAGLDHPADASCRAVTMWASAAPAETTKRTLEDGDRQGLAALYGAGAGTPAPAPVPAPTPTPTPAPTPAPTTPTLNSLSPRPSAPRGNIAFTLIATGASFQNTLQFVIRGGSCPAAGCIVTAFAVTPTSALGSTRLSSGTYTVGVRNSASGTLSATRNLNVR